MLTRHLRDRLGLFVTAIYCAAILLAFPCRSQEGPPGAIPLQLEVSINGQSRKLIAAFFDLGNGRMASTAQELKEVGIKPPPGAKPTDVVALDDVGGLTYTYDEPAQAINIVTSDKHRVAQKIHVSGRHERLTPAASQYGAVVNYSLYAGYDGAGLFTPSTDSGTTGVNVGLDARAFSPYGVLSQTAILGMTLADETNALRLDTTYTYVNDNNATQWNVGDFVTGGTAWSRPVRMGGVQFRRTFAARPDVVKNPVPVLSGSAAVPSSVDVYVNGVKSFSRDVEAGPFAIENASSLSGSGVAQIVTRDASGRRTVQEVTFFNSSQLLKPGLSDFSVEAGLARNYYGVLSNEYDKTPFASATLRRGITDWLTLEGHGEGSTELINGGAGFAAKVLNRGVISGAASGSLSDNGAGYQLYGSLETKVGRVNLRGSSQRAFSDYDDIATLTARESNKISFKFGAAISAGSLFAFEPPKAIDTLTLSMPMPEDRSSVGLSYLRYEFADDSVSEIIAANYSRQLTKTINFRATGFVDLNNRDNAGVYAGVSMPLGDEASLSTGLSSRNGKTGGYVSANKSLKQAPGSWGWSVSDNEDEVSRREAKISYRAQAARLEAGVTQYDAETPRATALVEGAVAYMGGSVFASNRIDDSFAVVDVHVPNVKIKRDNQVVAVSDADGKAIIPHVSSYQKNKISIEPEDLPLNAEPEVTYTDVVPKFRNGVYVDFDVKLAPPSAIVILKMPDGKVVPAGSEARIEGSEEPVVVGYDGQAYVKGLQPVNTLRVTMEGGTCTAQFAFEASGEAQQTIGPEICQ